MEASASPRARECYTQSGAADLAQINRAKGEQPLQDLRTDIGPAAGESPRRRPPVSRTQFPRPDPPNSTEQVALLSIVGGASFVSWHGATKASAPSSPRGLAGSMVGY